MLRAVFVFLAIASCRSPSSKPSAGSAAATVADAATAAVVDAATAAAAVTDGAVETPRAAIKDWPIKWPPERDKAMVEYRRAHSDAAATDTVIVPKMIVLHYTAGGSAKGTHDYFDNLHMEEARAELRKGGDVNVSAHFLVDRDGTIFRLVPETRMARHAIGVNHIAIGVENVGDEAKFPLTDAQIEADAALVRDLVARYPSIELLVGHHEVRSLEGTEWFVERDPKYRNKKPDPGPRFMAAVRAKVADLKLKGPDDVRPSSP